MLVYWRVPLPKKSHIQIQCLFCGTMSGSKISQMTRSESLIWWTTFNDDVKENGEKTPKFTVQPRSILVRKPNGSIMQLLKWSNRGVQRMVKFIWKDSTNPRCWEIPCLGKTLTCQDHSGVIMKTPQTSRTMIFGKSIKTTTHVLVWSS